MHYVNGDPSKDYWDPPVIYWNDTTGPMDVFQGPNLKADRKKK